MYRIKIYGLGGQGVVTAANILSQAVSMHENRFAKTIPAYGHERRGAPVYSDVMIDDNYIMLNSFVYEPDFVILFDPSFIDRDINIEKGIHKNSILVANAGQENVLDRLEREFKFNEIFYVDATQIAIEQIGINIPNGAMLGAIAKTGIVKIDSIKKAIKEFFENKIGEKNARAANEAFKKTKKK